jgi:hypothetical protein
MPCHVDPSPYDDLHVKYRDMERKADEATRVACEALKALDAYESAMIGRPLTALSAESREWWRRHKILDQKRVLRNQALAKLTPEEQDALGVK